MMVVLAAVAATASAAGFASTINSLLEKTAAAAPAEAHAEGRAMRADRRRLSVSDCTSSSDIAQVGQLTMDPPEPKKGDSYELHFNICGSKTISGGKAHYTTSLSGFPVLDEKTDLCEDLAGASVDCPVAPPADMDVCLNQWDPTELYAVVSDSDLPTSLPSGQYKGRIQYLDDGGAEILCIDFSYRL